MSTALDVLVLNPALRDAFAARDRDRLQAVALPILQTLKSDHGIGHWNWVEDASKKMFLRVHLPSKYGDISERAGLSRAISRQETGSGKELGKSAFALRVDRPFFADGKVIGYIGLGEEIDHFLGKMKNQTGNEFAMFISKKFIDQSEWARTRGQARNNWGDFTDVVVVNSTTSEQLVDQAAIQGSGALAGTILEEVTREGATFARGVFPVREATGNVVGGLVVRHDITALHTGMRNGLLQALGFLAALAVVASVLAYLFVDRLIFGRLRKLMATMEDLSARLAGGDFGVAAAVRATRKDEIGAFERFFGEFLGLVSNMLHTLSERAKGQAARAAPLRPPARPPSA
jgi:methyl-accepting chemotaxis protein